MISNQSRSNPEVWDRHVYQLADTVQHRLHLSESDFKQKTLLSTLTAWLQLSVGIVVIGIE